MENSNYNIGFALGRDIGLSVAEVFAYLTRERVEVNASKLVGEILLLEVADDAETRLSINKLGGSIKMFRVLGTYLSGPELVEKLLTEINYESEKRVNFGVSGYGNVNKGLILKVGYDIKNKLQESGYAARFVTGKTIDLSSVIVNENKLIERGFEAIIVGLGDGYLLGTTIAVQDYKAYSKRDFGRPVRNARNGMLPPKLAQIMINLAALPTTATLYDPFCGSGTILQEALFLGYRDIYGSDIEKSNIDDTTKNLEWLYQGFGMPRVPNEKLFISDVLSPSQTVKSDAIVGEGYLGEPVRINKDRALAESEKLAVFYTAALSNLKKQLEPGGTLVIAVPFFVVGKEYFYLPIADSIKTLGLLSVNYIPETLDLRQSHHGNLTYSREDQFVGREILVLKNK